MEREKRIVPADPRRPLAGRPLSRVRNFIGSPSFPKKYAIICLILLLATTVIWALLGASLQRSNADQIVDTYLFENSKTFHAATFPASHSLLLKWPLFFFIQLFGVSGFSLALFTVLVSLATVIFLAFIIYRIERRPFYFGTLCLALASVLLLIPAQPYPGALLPVNMAMITGRNLEYIFYIASLALLIRSPRIKSFSFWLAMTLMALVIASDRLFLIFGLGGAILAFVVYRLRRSDNLARLSFKWLKVVVIALLAALIGAWLIDLSGYAHFSGQSGVGPFGLDHGPKNIVLGSLYATLGLLTNFGANPAYDSVIVRHIPGQIHARLAGIGSVGFIINAAILAIAMLAVWRVLAAGIKNAADKKIELDKPTQLATALIWSSVAAFAAFIVTNHYYAVDARYLTIAMFTGFISIAVYLRTKNWSPRQLIFAGAVITLGIVFGLAFSLRTYNANKTALHTTDERNLRVAAVIAHHHIDTLVGDYWRVIPIKLATHSSINVMPFTSCSQPLDALSSKAWQVDLKNKSFAFLISFDHSLTNYQNCSLDQVIAGYGRPNTSTLVAGSLSHPAELILFYDKGINKSSPLINPPTPQLPATILPTTLDKLPNTFCQGPTVMNTVAHQDDDLLFMTPDLLHDLQSPDKCVRTVYLTAGDAGSDQFYWLNREQGSEAAYAKMIGYDGVWIKRIVRLGDNQYIRVDNPRGNSKVSLIFVRLSDGNVRGQGFRATNYESLEKLEAGKIRLMHSADGQSDYSYGQLQDMLLSLMRTYGPSEIHTQSTYVDHRFPDHSDHIAVSRLTRQVWQQYDAKALIKFYLGYPSYGRPSNVFGTDLQQSEDAFFAYAKFDPSVCGSEIACQKSKASYGAYLHTQYTSPE